MKEEEVSTVVGSGVHLTGTLKDQSDIVVHGTVEGEVKSDQNVIVGDSAKVKGPISALVVNISGEVSGTIQAHDKLEIHPTGHVEGNIKTKDLIIHSGAYFAGKSEMTNGTSDPVEVTSDMIEHTQESENSDDKDAIKVDIEEE